MLYQARVDTIMMTIIADNKQEVIDMIKDRLPCPTSIKEDKLIADWSDDYSEEVIIKKIDTDKKGIIHYESH